MGEIFYPQARAILQLVLDGFGENAADVDPFVVPVIPKEVSIIRNGYNQADSWSLTFDAQDFVIDPEAVRAGAAEIFVFQTDGVLDRERSLGSRQTAFNDTANRKPATIEEALALEQEFQAAVRQYTLEEEPTIAGIFDDINVEMSGSGKWCTITGQDYTAFLAGKQFPPQEDGRARRIPTGDRLDRTLANLLSEADEEGRLRIKLEEAVDASELPIVGAAETRGNRRGIPVGADLTYWDVMYKIAIRYGFILFVRGLNVVLSRPKNLNESSGAQIRAMAWGKNIESLEMGRKLGKEKSPVIVVRSFDPKLNSTVEAQYPRRGLTEVLKRNSSTTLTTKIRAKKKKKKKANNNGLESIRKSEEFQIIPIFGITDKDILTQVAKNLHELLARPERYVRFTTRNLEDLRGGDLLSIVTGDAVEIRLDDFNRELILNPNVSEDEKFSHLISRGYGEAIARIIASNSQKVVSLSRPMRVREASIEYSADNGVDIEVELMNYVTIDGIRDPSAKPSAEETRSTKFSK